MTEALAAVGWVPLVTLLLLLAGVVGSVIPGVPGAGLSLAGVLFYWWRSGFASPGAAMLVGLLGLGAFALLTDWFGGAAAAKAGGASALTTAIAAVVGIALLFVAGPLGVLVGIAGTVFLLEYRRNRDARRSVRAAGYATVGILASTAVQVLATGAMLVAMLVFLF